MWEGSQWDSMSAGMLQKCRHWQAMHGPALSPEPIPDMAEGLFDVDVPQKGSCQEAAAVPLLRDWPGEAVAGLENTKKSCTGSSAQRN